MIENVLALRGVSLGRKVTVKSVISLGIIALAVGLPLIVHAIAGAAAGAQWLPMYLPVVLGGCLLGAAWGAGIGVLSPVVSYLITLAAGDPMPVLVRLPYMAVELAVIGAVSGLFSNKIVKNGFAAFPAVILSLVAGRAVFMLTVAIFQTVSPLKPAAVWAQIKTGALAVVIQAVVVPMLVIGLKRLIVKE